MRQHCPCCCCFPPACKARQEVGSKFRVETVKCPNCCRLLLPALPYSLRAEIFPDKKVDDTVSLLCGHNLKMIIIIKAIIGFEISFWTGFFQIPRIWYGRWLRLTREWPAGEAGSGPPWARPRTTHRWQEQNIERRDPTHAIGTTYSSPRPCLILNQSINHFWVSIWYLTPYDSRLNK